jgi:DNA-binding transcriptional LysR family regulator
MQTIAGNWLAPRLGGFQLLHPEYTVRLDISPNMVDLENEGVDVVIRSGKGIWPGLTSHFLLTQTFTPFAARIISPARPTITPRHSQSCSLTGRHLVADLVQTAGLDQTTITRTSIDEYSRWRPSCHPVPIALVSPAFVKMI